MEHFIDTIRRYPCLWNTAAVEYRDQELKDAAWAQVVKETEFRSVKEAKFKWKKLRDSYRDALKRQAAPGDPSKRVCPWRYANDMHFLQPFINYKRRAPPSDEDEPTAPEQPCPESVYSAPCPEQTYMPQCPEAIVSSELSPEVVPRAASPLTLFFSSMCGYTRRLPPARRLLVQRVLFDTVTQHLAVQHTPTARQSSSSDDQELPAC